MEMIPLLLYFIGLILLCFFVISLALKLYKKSSLMKIITVIVIVLSLILLCTGAALSLLSINNASKDTKLEDYSSNSEPTLTTTSYSDLSFLYVINSTSIEGDKQTTITICNNSNFIFNGTVTINVLDDNKSIINTIQLPIKNLTSQESKDTTLQVTKNASSITYSFTGDFSEGQNFHNSNYSIANMSIGNTFIRFEVFTQDDSLENLSNICKEFKATYINNLSQGFLIYFINTKESNFIDSKAEFFYDITTRTTTLTTYSDNKKYQIS